MNALTIQIIVQVAMMLILLDIYLEIIAYALITILTMGLQMLFVIFVIIHG